MQKYGGISRYFYEIMRVINTKKGYLTHLSIRLSANHYLKKFPGLSYRHINYILKGFNWIVYKTNRVHAIRSTLKMSRDFDVFHPTYYDPYFIPYLLNKPFVLTIHDMIHDLFPEYFYSFSATSRNKRLLAKRASQIIAVSQNTKKDIIERYGIRGDKITVIYHGVSCLQQNDRLHIPLPKKFLLYVGDRHKYKNFQTFIQSITSILREENWYLVCFGGEAFSNEEKSSLHRLGIHQKVTKLSGDDALLAYLYRHASVYICPSLYEGFGMPVLEALSLGCPVASSNASSLPEVGGNAVSYFDPRHKLSIESAVRRIINDNGYRLDLIQRGLKQAQNFSWDKAAEETCGVYENALKMKEVSSL